MSIEATRRFTILSSHLNPTRFNSDPHSFSISASLLSSQTQQDDHCVFCNIIRGQSPALKLYEDDTCLCILDTSPVSHGHSLIIPKSHFPSLDATPPSVIAAMCSKVPFISNAIMKATGCNSFNLLINNGAAAGQVIFHSLLRHPLNLDDEKVSQLATSIQEQLMVSDICQESKNEDFCSSKS
ncbi:adenylylsulfatase HINT3 isoform X2 [Trifolium pratense]|uniref:Uncharacterized protein n=1 Tax=Trifolium pratense TaxID=57577 RepID=A0ACB0LKX2_TRIPR|nr:adenylylsulfatase HINT3 isoform X2 [Trifolium pratense]CAJ2670048.1 unnamed protein product [Trifolium pratense]